MLAAQGVSPEQLDVALDTTDDGREVPLVRHDKRPEVRTNRYARKVEGTVFGWENARRFATVRSVALDRGFTDGRLVGANEHEGIHGRETTALGCTRAR